MTRPTIWIDIDNRAVLAAIQGAEQRLARPDELMRLISAHMLAAVEDNFEQQGRPKKWTDLKDATKAQRQKLGHWPGHILQRSGNLKNNIVQHWDSKQAVVGSNEPYAAIQHFGGKTKPHTIRPRQKKALSFAGRILKSVKHPGSDIPARPFLHMTAQDMQHLAEDIGDWYLQALRP